MKYVPTNVAHEDVHASDIMMPLSTLPDNQDKVMKAVSSPNIFVNHARTKVTHQETQFELDEENPDDQPTLEQKYHGLVTS
jgi:hypothetical protein